MRINLGSTMLKRQHRHKLWTLRSRLMSRPQKRKKTRRKIVHQSQRRTLRIVRFLPMKNCKYQAMLDHSIILHILYHSSTEHQVYSLKTKKECTKDSSMIFFPAEDPEYCNRLDEMDSLQYMQRLTLLYSMIWKTN